jgi:16S rRNA (guanine527-N7)-methyltransferase
VHDKHLADRDVSRETLEKLQAFESLVSQWSPRINLISSADLKNVWRRHIADSVQLVVLAEGSDDWADLGSGAGFPGLVVAICSAQKRHVTMVESDRRKCAFLSTVARQLDLNVKIIGKRIEDTDSLGAAVLSARALAPLTRLLGYADAHMSSDGVALFPKGQSWKNELARAREVWLFDHDVVKSSTDSDAAILKIRNIKRI